MASNAARSSTRRGGRRLAQGVAAVAIWAVGMVTLYREPIVSRFERLNGNIGDQRLLIVLSEHWLQVFKGHAGWRDPPYFFPVRGVLGYSDTLTLYQPLYIPLRLLGLNPFLAYQLTVMGLSTIGFFGALYFARRSLRVRFAVALLGAYLFTFSSALAMKLGHTQLYALNLLPVLGLLVGTCVQALRAGRSRRAAMFGAATGLFLALLLFTSFYIGWFSLLAGAIVLACVVVTASPVTLRRLVQALVHRRRAVALVAGASVVGFALGSIPLLVTYLPTLEASGGRTYSEIRALAPVPSDVLNVGAANLVWGSLLRRVGLGVAQLHDNERSMAVPLLLVASVVAGVILLLVMARRWRVTDRARLVGGLLLAGLLLTVLPDVSKGVSLWAIVWSVVPGSHAIRATGRLELLTNVVFVVAVVLVLDALAARAAHWSPRRQRAALGSFGVLAVLLAAEQVQVRHFADLSQPVERSGLDAVPGAPARCRAFWVSNPPPGRPFFAVQIDAMLIAVTQAIPTINGYSGLTPTGWELVDPASPAYDRQVTDWLERNGLQGDPGDGICSYDLTSATWS